MLCTLVRAGVGLVVIATRSRRQKRALRSLRRDCLRTGCSLRRYPRRSLLRVRVRAGPGSGRRLLQRREECLQVRGELGGGLHRREVLAALELAPVRAVWRGNQFAYGLVDGTHALRR